MNDSINTVCAHCNTVVRTARERLSDAPHCPRCHNPLFEGHPIELRAHNFDQHISQNDVPVIVDFWASWCGPCQAFAPRFEQAAKQFEPRVRFAKVCTEDEPGIAQRFNVRSIPTVIAFRKGAEAGRQMGAMDGGSLARWIQSVAH